MKFERIRGSEAPELGPNSLSNCKKAGDRVFISGLLSWDGNQEFIGKADALVEIEAIGEEPGAESGRCDTHGAI